MLNIVLLTVCNIHVMESKSTAFTGVYIYMYFSQDSEKKRQRRENDLVTDELKMANKEFIKVWLIIE